MRQQQALEAWLGQLVKSGKVHPFHQKKKNEALGKSLAKGSESAYASGTVGPGTTNPTHVPPRPGLVG
jgi:hypothetical protein